MLRRIVDPGAEPTQHRRAVRPVTRGEAALLVKRSEGEEELNQLAKTGLRQVLNPSRLERRNIGSVG